MTFPEDVGDILPDNDVITDDVIFLDNNVITGDVIMLDNDVTTDDIILLDNDGITDDIILLVNVVITGDVIFLDNVVITGDIILLVNVVITDDIILLDSTGFDGFGFVDFGFVGNVVCIDDVISFVSDFSDDAIVYDDDDVITYDVIISGDVGGTADDEANEGVIAGVGFNEEFADRGIRNVWLVFSCMTFVAVVDIAADAVAISAVVDTLSPAEECFEVSLFSIVLLVISTELCSTTKLELIMISLC